MTTGFESGIPMGEIAGERDIFMLDRPGLGHSCLYEFERRPRYPAPSLPQVPVQNLLKDLRRGHQRGITLSGPVKKRTRFDPERVTAVDKVHEDVRVNENRFFPLSGG